MDDAQVFPNCGHWAVSFLEFDLVIVGSGGGGGGGGMAAALTAYDSGLSCVVIEKGARFGGSTGVSGGGI